jgi:hypothetical protein
MEMNEVSMKQKRSETPKACPPKLHKIGKELQETNISGTTMTTLLSTELQTYDEWNYITKRNGKGGTKQASNGPKEHKVWPKEPKVGPMVCKMKEANNEIGNEIQDIIEKQKQIGWQYIIRGFFAEAWGAQQELYMRSNDKAIVGDSWSAKISQWWIEKMYKKWRKRNNEIHTPLVGPSRDEAETLTQVRLLYEHEHEILEQDRNIFNMPMERRLEIYVYNNAKIN